MYKCILFLYNKNEQSLYTSIILTVHPLHNTTILSCDKVEDNKSLTMILPEGKSAHTDDPEIHLNSLGILLLEASWRLGGHE